MENNTFSYRYSAEKNKEVENIRKRYEPHRESKLERLKRLDGRVQSAGMIESLSLGIVGVLIFGLGMCFGLDVLYGADWLTVLLCAVGTAIMIPAYPIYKHIYRKTKSRLTPEILRLSDEIMNSAKNL